MTLSIETIMLESRSYYSNKDSTLVGLTSSEAQKARENGIDLGHVSYQGTDEKHLEYPVKNVQDREALAILFG